MTRLRSICLAATLPAILAGAPALVPALAGAAPGPLAHRPSRPVCPGPAFRAAGCGARVVTDSGGTPLAGSGPSGYGPAQFHAGYELPTAAPAPQTIAIVDAYDDPTIEADLAVYSETYGLPACTTANGCFRKVNQNGQEGPYPARDAGWSLEIALDVETAHAICQNCEILLVEASSNLFTDLAAAVDTAASLGATEISNSYGGSEFAGEATDSSYDHPGIAITASAGDGGYGAEYPAASPHVVAVGGTTLTLGPGDGYGGETVWSGSGSGCSAYLPAQAWQLSDPAWALTGCGTARGIADVAADADPNTGASVYDTTKYKGQSGWFKVGGTSLSAPLIAAVYALAGGASADYPAADPYAHQADSPASLHDVTAGSNGSCGSATICAGAPGYDGPTGAGTPRGVAAFAAAPAAEPHTLTVEPAPVGNVRSEPVGAINCGAGAKCSHSYESGEAVELVASQPAGATFSGWAGECDAPEGRVCRLAMSSDKTVEATYSTTHLLSVAKTGDPELAGNVHSSPFGINCGAGKACAASYPIGTHVTLTASQPAGSHFAGWKGADAEAAGCGAARVCEVTMSKDLALEAEYARIHWIEVQPTSTEGGIGNVRSEPAAFNCGKGAACMVSLEAGAGLKLIASQPAGTRFLEWTGDCTPVPDAPRSCEVTADADKTIGAVYE